MRILHIFHFHFDMCILPLLVCVRYTVNTQLNRIFIIGNKSRFVWRMKYLSHQ